MSDSLISLYRTLHEDKLQLISEIKTLDDGIRWCRKYSSLVDFGIRCAFEELAGTSAGFCVVATGGYAREELAPYSDADLAVIVDNENEDEQVRAFFSGLPLLEHELGIKVSYSFRDIYDIESLDIVSRTALLDLRLIAGSKTVFANLKTKIQSTHPVGEFIAEKIAERREQRERSNSTCLIAEPHLKDGAGGLRDLQTVNWIRDSLGLARLAHLPSYDYLLSVRNHLHKLSNKKNDFLNRAKQAEIAETTSTPILELLRDTTMSLEIISELFEESVQLVSEGSFLISPGIHSRKGEMWIEPGTEACYAAVGVAIATRLGIKVPKLPTGASTPTNGSAFVYALSTGPTTLRNLDRCQLLSKILPELENCRHLQPMDAVHQFTVFEHSLRVVENLFELDHRAWLQEIADQLPDLGLLALVSLLHDIGKIDPAQDHSVLGESLSNQICARLNLSDEESELVAWLVRNHLVMDHFCRFRDIDHPQTISEFCAILPSQKALDHLCLLTYADASAVGTGVWTMSQETFLRTLYSRASEAISHEEAIQIDSSVSRKHVLRALTQSAIGAEEAQELVDQLPAYYLAGTTIENVRIHVGYVRDALEGKPTIETYDRPDAGITEMTFCSVDQPGFLSNLLGVLYAHDLSISEIRACTTNSETPVALDVISVQFAGQCVPPATRKLVANSARAVMEGRLTVDEVLRTRGKNPDRKAVLDEWKSFPGNPTRLETRSPRGRGTPYRLSRWISEQGWNIHAARLGQWAGKAAATFYISRNDGEISEKVIETAVLTLQPD